MGTKILLYYEISTYSDFSVFMVIEILLKETFLVGEVFEELQYKGGLNDRLYILHTHF